MLALPAAPAPVRRRTLLVGTAYACAGLMAFFVGLIAIYLQQRIDIGGGNTNTWLPKKVVVPEPLANTMLLTFALSSLTVQWAVYSMRRHNRRDTAWAMGLLVVLGAAILNAQSFIWSQMKLPIMGDTVYNVLFYMVTGAFFLAVVVGLILAVIGAFRALAGRVGGDATEAFSALALYWHVLFGVFCFVWYVMYVVK